MKEESEEGEMEKKTWNKSSGGFLSQGQRSGSSKETVPKGKGQWRKDRSKGRDQPNRRPSDQDCQRQFKNLSERRDGTPPRRRGWVSDKRPPTKSNSLQNKEASKNLVLDLVTASDTTASSGPKRHGTSLNHLLNFKFAPREQLVANRIKFGRKRHQTFNKEQFLHANCQFVVHSKGDYSVYTVDPDILVDWSLVEQVRIFSHGVPSCPICLYPPTAAKMTRCGHIYCWACMLHYQSLSDKSWQKCPICYEAIHKTDLKSVVALANHQFVVGEKITMRLMKRSKDSVLALPNSQWQERDAKPFRINDPFDTHYSKLLLASSDEVLEQIVSVEEKELIYQLQQARSEQSEEQCFLESALQELKDRKEQLLEAKQAQAQIAETVKNATEEPELKEADTSRKQESSWKVTSTGIFEAVGEYEAAFSDAEEGEADQSAAQGEEIDSDSLSPSEASDVDRVNSYNDDGLKVVDKEGAGADSSHREEFASPGFLASGSEAGEEDQTYPAVISPGSSTPSSGYYYFYQAGDGQNIFLHPVNARCLMKEYGSLENCPEFITAQVVEMEAMSQTDELRRRYRYLSHLPLTCEFVICELDLKPPIVSRETLLCFKDIIYQRKQQRQKKMRSERRREKKIEANNASVNGFPTQAGCQRAESLNLASDVEFPSQGAHVPMSPPYSSSSRPSPFLQFAAANLGHDEGYGTMVDAEDLSASPPSQDNSSGWPPSFAQALRTRKVGEPFKAVKKPVKKTGATSAKYGSSAGDEEEANEDHVPVPTFQSAFSEALSASWGEAVTAGCGHQQQTATGQPEGTGKKQKKGKKKQLLFTTGNFMKYT